MSDLQTRCAAMIAALDDQMDWGLSQPQQAAYTVVIANLLIESCPDILLSQTIIGYHREHDYIAALRDPHHTQHDRLWEDCRTTVIRVIQHNRFAQADGSLASLDELTQVALEALSQALPSFKFRSQFSTWVYSTVWNSVQRYIKMLNAAKRGKENESLDQSIEAHAQIGGHNHPGVLAETRELQKLLLAILSQHQNPKMSKIFYLRFIEDYRVIDIGKHVNLSAGRVSVLLEQACQMLQEHPEILRWIADGDQPDAAQALGER